MYGTLGLLNGNRLNFTPPAVGKRHSEGAQPFHNQAGRTSLRNRNEDVGKGVSGSLTMNIHFLGGLGWPGGIPFLRGAFAAGYGGKYLEDHIGFLEFQFGIGLSLGELFASNPDFDLDFHTDFFRLGYNNLLGGYHPVGFNQYGGCVSLFKWSGCFDFGRLEETNTVETGLVTEELEFATFSLGRHF